jgi:hypothetical protein
LKDTTNHHFRYKTLCFDGLNIRVGSQQIQDLVWLKEFLSPSFRVTKSETSDCRVNLTSDPLRYEKISARGAHAAGRLADCFALDSKTVRLPLWTSEAEERVIFDQQHRVFYSSKHNGSEILIVAGDHNPWEGRIALMRTVRELAMNYSSARGGIILHGSAILAGRRGIVFAGPKHSGKTTLLIHCLRNRMVKYLSNDRVVMFLGQGRPVLRGMPTIVTIRPSTLEIFPGLGRRLTRTSYYPCLTLSESRKALLGPIVRDDEERFSLSPAQIHELLGIASSTQVRAWALLFPRITNRAGTIKLRQLPTLDAVRKLRQSLFRAHFSNKASEVFCPPGSWSHPDQHDLQKVCREVVSKVRCFDCELGRQAYREKHPAQRLLDQLDR